MKYNEISMLDFLNTASVSYEQYGITGLMADCSRLFSLQYYLYGCTFGNLHRGISVTTTSVSSVWGASGLCCTEASLSK